MITAVDTSVLLDVFTADPKFGRRSSAEAIRACIAEGSLVACEVVWAELASAFPSPEPMQRSMRRLGVQFDALEVEAAVVAGEAWKAYRNRGGRRARVIADFLIGAHAQHRADRLLSRDRGFYRAYFRRLRLLDPTDA